jgi:AraC family transcriptional activator of pobA
VEAIQTRSRLYHGEIAPHLHHGLYQVLWVASGPVQSVLDASRSSGQGPLAVVVPPGVAHAFQFSEASDGHVLTFDARLLAEGEADAALAQALQRLFAQPRRLDVPAHLAQRLQPLFAAMLAEHDSASPGPVPAWLARTVVWRLAELADAAGRAASGPLGVYPRWVALMEQHYLQHWPVGRYALALGLSTERLNRLLQAETGHNAQALLHQRLAREACRRLVHVAAPVARIADELGFADPAYFCRFFKREVGTTPRAYRQAAWGTDT